MIRDHIREQRMLNKRVTASEVRSFLVMSGIMTSFLEPSSSLFQVRCVHWYLIRKGFCHGKKSSMPKVNEMHIIWRTWYLRLLSANRALPQEERRHEVSLDESYIHQHHSANNYCIYDPTDEQYEDPVQNHKGRRYCFCATIAGGGKHNNFGNIPWTLWRFTPKASQESKVDFGKNFNDSNFGMVSWYSST